MKDADLPERIRHSIAHDERDALPFMRATLNEPRGSEHAEPKTITGRLHLVVSVKIENGEASDPSIEEDGGPWAYSDAPMTWIDGEEWIASPDADIDAARALLSAAFVPPPVPVTTMRECVNANALACLAELRGAALAVLANGSPTPDKLQRLAKACEQSAWVDA